MVAQHPNGGGIFSSTDGGATWTQTSASNENWISIASSSDGTRLAAVAYGGGIYSAQATIQTSSIYLFTGSETGGQFGFNITGPANATIVVEACTNLANPVWIPVATNALSNGTNYFSDAQWTNYPYPFLPRQ